MTELPEADAVAALTHDACDLEDSRVVRALQEYRAARQAGKTPDRNDLLTRFPQVADELTACLDALDFVQAAAPQLQSTEGNAIDAETAALLTSEVPLGDYRLVRELGRGGMGVVYEAVQLSLGRRVALKILPFASALDTRHLQRFRAEAQSAALLHHQHIVPVYAVGCERGVHYYAMQFIEGRTLAALIDEMRQQEDAETRRCGDKETGIAGRASETEAEQQRALSASPCLPVSASSFCRTAARLGLQAAEALEYAHRQGVVHRDIKPANLILDGNGDIWITDFGLAHVRGDTKLTLTGDLVGTLRYMSPEQALGRPYLVDPRSDVYALGATLYELLTLQPAVGGQDRQEVLRQITDAEPTPLRRLQPAIPVELETIVLKALAKDSEARYSAAQELADDLRRFLEDRPIQARRPTLAQRCRMWARRHRSVVWTSGVLLVVACIGLTVSTALIWRAHQHTKEALVQAETNAETAQRQRVRAEERELLARRHLYAAHLNLAYQAAKAGQVARAFALLRGQRPQADEEDLRSFEWRHLWHALQRGRTQTFRAAKGVTALAFSPDGRYVASGGDDGLVQVWDVSSGRAWLTLRPAEGKVLAATFAHDGRTLATGGSDGTVRLWDLSTAQPRLVIRAGAGPIPSVAVSPDATKVAGVVGKMVRIWDAESGRVLATTAAHNNLVNSVAFAPDGRTFASASHDGSVRLWDTATGDAKAVFRGHHAYVWAVAYSFDGRRLASCSDDGKVCVWDIAAPAENRPSQASVSTQKPLETLSGHAGSVSSVAFLPDGHTVVSSGEDGSVRVWDAAWEERGIQGHAAPVVALAVSPDGRTVASADADGLIALWSVRELREEPVLRGDEREVNVAAVSRDGRSLAAGTGSGAIKLWDLASGQEQATLKGHPKAVRALAFSSDDQMLASAGSDGVVRLWDIARRQELATWLADSEAVWGLSFSPDGQSLATAGYRDNAVKLWDVATRRLRQTLRGHTDRVWSVAFAPDGQTLASGGRDNVARLWDVATGREKANLVGLQGWVWAVAFSPDGSTLATAGQDGSVMLWDMPTCEHRITIRAHTTFVRSVLFLPDGKTLATSSDDATIKLWDLATGQERAVLKGHRGVVSALAVDPTGSTLVSGSWDGTVHLWRTKPEQDEEERISPR